MALELQDPRRRSFVFWSAVVRRAGLAEAGEERPDVADELVRRLVRREVPTAVEHGPANDVGVVTLGEPADPAEVAAEPRERQRERRRVRSAGR